MPDLNADGAIDLLDVEHLLRHDANAVTPLEGDGDFPKPGVDRALDEADIVVTNPPWSLIRTFIPLMIDRGKQFLVLGDQNFITYHARSSSRSSRTSFGSATTTAGRSGSACPDDYEIKTESRKKIVDGVKYFSMGRAYWFTNLDTTRRHEPLTLYKRYCLMITRPTRTTRPSRCPRWPRSLWTTTVRWVCRSPSSISTTRTSSS